MSTQTGRTLSHYRLVEKIGEGGMGVVWKAVDTTLDREVAIKILPEALEQAPERLGRFAREAKAVAALNHPNIVTIHSVEETGGVHFISMELVKGKALSELIPRGGFGLAKLFELAVPLADAVSAAHQQGITHRDLKPDNVMVTGEGRLKVLDFGLAKLRDDAGSGGGDIHQMPTTTVTAEGTILGTVAYMSPEQAEGKPIDHRSDIFSLGVMLYQMACGKRPFTGDTSVSIISSILKDTPAPVTEVNRSLPRHLSRIIRHCLRKNPEHRFQSAKDLRNELTELKEEVDSGEAIAPPMRQGRRALFAAAATLTVAAVLTVAWWIGNRPDSGDNAQQGASATFDQLTTMPGEELFPSLAPDGKSLVYSGKASGNWDIYLLRVGGQRSVNLTAGSEDDDTQAAFSPDGELIAFRSERDGGGIFVMGATGESVRRVTDFGFNPAWSPDGSTIAFATEGVQEAGSRYTDSELWVVTPATGETRRVEVEDAVQPHWSPGGHRISYWATHPGTGRRDIWTIPATGGTVVPVTDDEFVDWNPVWSPKGDRLFFLSDRGGTMNLWSVRIDEASGRVLSGPESMTIPNERGAHLTVSGDGRRIAYAAWSSTSNIQRVSFDPATGQVGDPLPITTGANLFWSPSVSPDGRWLAFGTGGPPWEDLVVMRVDGSELRMLTEDPHKDRVPAWSPDGSRIGFYSDRSGRYEIWTILPDGRGLRQLTRTGTNGGREGSLNYPRWSPDGSRMSVSSEGPFFLLELDRAGNVVADQEQPPMPDPDMRFVPWSWSPDAMRLAGHSRWSDGQLAGLWSYTPETGEYRLLADSGAGPLWLGDGQRLVFRDQGKLYILDRASEAPRELLSLEPGLVGSFRISKDERWIFMARADEESNLWLMTLD